MTTYETAEQRHAAIHRQWAWYTGALKPGEPCERCAKPLRTDPQIVERQGRRYHLPCFLDFICTLVNAYEQRAAAYSADPDAAQPFKIF